MLGSIIKVVFGSVQITPEDTSKAVAERTDNPSSNVDEEVCFKPLLYYQDETLTCC